MGTCGSAMGQISKLVTAMMMERSWHAIFMSQPSCFNCVQCARSLWLLVNREVAEQGDLAANHAESK